MGRVKLLGIPLLAVLVLGLIASARPAAAQTKTARGTATAVSDSSLTVKGSDGKEMTFAVDSQTKIEARGAGTQTRREGGVKVTEYVKTGGNVMVTYRETGGTMVATSIRPVASAGGAPGPETKTATGTVKSVSDSSLTVTSGGKDMTFAVSSRTTVQGRGAGTATRAAGGAIPITGLVSTGDTVSVRYTEAGSAMNATQVRVTVKAK